MIYAERGNRVRQINEADIERYTSQGYTIKDDSGNIVKECIPTDMATLKLAYTQHTATIKQLTDKIEELTKEIESLKKAKAPKAKVEKAE